jgi:hypothetical protein
MLVRVNRDMWAEWGSEQRALVRRGKTDLEVQGAAEEGS